MALCEFCNQEMTIAKGCLLEKFDDFTDGKIYPRIKFYSDSPDHTCHDCGVASGYFHHPGCDMERCPRCGGQAISCPCEKLENRLG